MRVLCGHEHQQHERQEQWCFEPAWTWSTTRAMMRWSTSTNSKGHKQHQKNSTSNRENWLGFFLEGDYPILISYTVVMFQHCPLLMQKKPQWPKCWRQPACSQPFLLRQTLLVRVRIPSVRACVWCVWVTTSINSMNVKKSNVMKLAWTSTT